MVTKDRSDHTPIMMTTSLWLGGWPSSSGVNGYHTNTNDRKITSSAIGQIFLYEIKPLSPKYQEMLALPNEEQLYLAPVSFSLMKIAKNEKK